MAVSLWDVVRVPFGAVRYVYREFRKALFTAPRPSGEYLVTEASVEDVERGLGNQSYAPNWEFSYYERGEDLNLARVVYERREAGGSVRRWWQTHVRGWANDAGQLELHGHWELEPTENGNAHIDGVGFDIERGMATLRSALEAAGIEYGTTTVEMGSGH